MNSRAKLPPTRFGFGSYTQSPHHMSLHCSNDESLNLSTFIPHFPHCTLGHKPASCFPNLFPLLSGFIEDYSPALPFGHCSCVTEFQPEGKRAEVMDITSWPGPSSLVHLILHLIIFFQLEEGEHAELGCYISKCWSQKMQEGQTPLYVVWRRVRNQSRTSVLALKGTRDTLRTWFHHMCWGHFVTAAGVILTNAYMI